MNPVQFDAPGATIIFNALYASADPALLAQDLSLLRLADGSYVDVGWYPQFDPDGDFKITHYQGDWDHVVKVLRTRSVNDVVEWINQLARDSGAPSPRMVS